MDKLVSIITPCYNGEHYIKRYAESLISQTYHKCQLIFMDDGSTDETRSIIMQYEGLLNDNGIQLEYHYHKNIGVGATIAEGIKYVKGDYFIWPDVDDVLPPDSIKKKVDFLENNTQYGLVRTNFVVTRDTPENIINDNGTALYKNRSKENLFEDYLVSKNMWLQPGCYMIRTSSYDAINPDRYIYPTRTGQNWQILLPILWAFKCGYLDDRLYVYIVRSSSLSNMAKGSIDRERVQLEAYADLITHTIEHMKMQEKKKKKYIDRVRIYYTQQQVSLGYKYSDKQWAMLNWEHLSIKGRNLRTWFKKTFAETDKVKRFVSILKGN